MKLKIDNWELWKTIYGQVKTTEPISKDEEKDIYSNIKSKEARDRLIQGYMWLVIRISNQLFVHECSNRDDILNSGVLELCECADRFKVEPNKKFIDLASQCIKGRMWKEMRKSDGMVPMPRIKEELSQRMGNMISLSSVVRRDKCNYDSMTELWEIIPDPNQIDVDSKIDQEKFHSKFIDVFNTVLKDMPYARGIIIDCEGLFGEDRITIPKAGQKRGMLRQTAHRYRSKGLQVLKKSEEMKRLYDNL